MWISLEEAHGVNFDKLVPEGTREEKFHDGVKKVMAQEFGHFLEHTKKLAVLNKDNPFIVSQSGRTLRDIQWVKEDDIAYLNHKPTLFERAILILYDAGLYLKVLAIVLTIIMIFCIIYVYRKLSQLRRDEHILMYPLAVPEPTAVSNPKWERVVKHIESTNENDWRLAVLESDIMLADLLETFGLPGETIGEKLKAVEKSDFLTIDSAWEAHKVRNQIAHEGADFMLSQREARRVIELYRAVFEEFHII